LLKTKLYFIGAVSLNEEPAAFQSVTPFTYVTFSSRKEHIIILHPSPHEEIAIPMSLGRYLGLITGPRSMPKISSPGTDIGPI
jgi:hypothetical protein